MDHWERTSRAIDFIEHRLTEPLAIEDIAKCACFSQFHFQRVFQLIIGQSVKEYVRGRRLHEATRDYPHNDEYRIWPGPNSNTYIAYLGRAVPELSLDLPPTAIGKDYLPRAGVLAHAPSGSGMQLSIAGLAGVIVAPQEGLEVNVLGLTAGIDVWPPALKLPGIVRIGWPSESRGGGEGTATAAQ